MVEPAGVSDVVVMICPVARLWSSSRRSTPSVESRSHTSCGEVNRVARTIGTRDTPSPLDAIKRIANIAKKVTKTIAPIRHAITGICTPIHWRNRIAIPQHAATTMTRMRKSGRPHDETGPDHSASKALSIIVFPSSGRRRQVVLRGGRCGRGRTDRVGVGLNGVDGVGDRLRNWHSLPPFCGLWNMRGVLSRFDEDTSFYAARCGARPDARTDGTRITWPEFLRRRESSASTCECATLPLHSANKQGRSGSLRTRTGRTGSPPAGR